jgi:rhodanese-related sulfurtransferase
MNSSPTSLLGRALLAFAVALCLQSAIAADKSGPPPIKHIDARNAEKLLSKTNLVILDIRTPEEFKSFHIAGATNIDFHGPNFEQRINSLDKSKTYLVHCASGGRSTQSLKIFQKHDFQSIYHLDGGINAWKNAGLPVEK